MHDLVHMVASRGSCGPRLLWAPAKGRSLGAAAHGAEDECECERDEAGEGQSKLNNDWRNAEDLSKGLVDFHSCNATDDFSTSMPARRVADTAHATPKAEEGNANVPRPAHTKRC